MPAASNSVPPEYGRGRNRVSRSVWIGVALLIMVGGAWQVVRSRETGPPLPDLPDVRNIQASYFDREKETKVTFQAPREHWHAIFSALLPARRDRSPAKWAGLGDLQLTLSNGDSYQVSLYSLGEETGAFSSGPTFERRVYYRGGNSTALEQALAEAYRASEEK